MTAATEPLAHWKDDLESCASSEFSQGGEDGVLLRLFEHIGVAHRYFVEFGAWDGRHLSNTANLRLNHGWSGLLMEGSDRADGVLVQREHVDVENVEALFRRYGVPRDFDLRRSSCLAFSLAITFLPLLGYLCVEFKLNFVLFLLPFLALSQIDVVKTW